MPQAVHYIDESNCIILLAQCLVSCRRLLIFLEQNWYSCLALSFLGNPYSADTSLQCVLMLSIDSFSAYFYFWKFVVVIYNTKEIIVINVG